MKKQFIIAAVLGCLSAKGQQAVTNSGVLRIHSGGIIAFHGNFTNASSATLVNNGSVYAKATLSNNEASMSPGTGTLYLNGSAQIIAGAEAWRVYNLTTDNTNGITLNNNLHVSNVHTFTNGRIITSVTPNYLVYEAGSSYTGASDGRHVNGWVKKIGTTNFTFPVGNGTYLREIAISNLSASSEFNARHHTVTPDANNLLLPLKSINPNEYWTLNKISGGTAQVIMNWDHSKIVFPNYVVSDITTALYSSQWASQGGTASGTTTTTGTITSNSISSFGPMVIGSASFVVPLDFLDITAKRRNNTTVVEWKTANEVDVKQYEVQKGFTPTLFTTMGTVTARNVQTEQTYSLPDVAHANGTMYYRIKSVDNNGSYKYSKVVALTIGNGVTKPVLLTNPARNQLLLTVPETFEVYNYRFAASNGQLTQQGSIKKQGSLLSISLPPLSKGIYHLTLYYGHQSHYEKVVVQ
jgi:hypothetical protein